MAEQRLQEAIEKYFPKTSVTKTGVSRRDIVSGFTTKTNATDEQSRMLLFTERLELWRRLLG